MMKWQSIEDNYFFVIHSGLQLAVARDTPLPSRERIFAEIAESAAHMRVEMKRPNGEMPHMMDVQRFFVTCNRGFSIVVRCEFHDVGAEGKFGSGIRQSTTDRLANLDRIVKMFLN